MTSWKVFEFWHRPINRSLAETESVSLWGDSSGALGHVVLASRLPAAGKQRLASQNCGNTTVRCVLADLAGDVVYVYV